MAESNILCRSVIKGSWKAALLISFYLLREAEEEAREEYFKVAGTLAEMCGYAEHYNAVLTLARVSNLPGDRGGTNLSALLGALSG